MKEFALLLPEIFLMLTLAGMIAGEIGYHGERIRLVSATALVGLGAALAQILISYQHGATRLFGNTLAIDGLSVFFKLFFVLLAGLTVILTGYTAEIRREKRTEFFAFIVASALAMFIVASSADLLVVFLAFQFMNVLAYFMAGYGKKNIISTEASVKYLLFSVVSGAFFLYAVAILFSHTQTLNMYDMHDVLLNNPLPAATGLVVFVLLFLSLCFYFGAFPMYLWVPDVLQGAPTPATTFLALGVPAAGFAVALRFFIVVFSQPGVAHYQWQILGNLNWTKIVALASGVTMMVGALLALRQQRAKRMLACLVVSHTGFMLMGLLVLDTVGVSALLYNLIVGLFSLVGLFAAFSFLFDHLGSDRLSDFRGVLLKALPESICLLLFLACFVGFPPFPGFIGKFVLIGAVVRDSWYGLSVLAILSLVLLVASFARLAYSLVGVQQSTRVEKLLPEPGQRAFLFGLLVPVILLSFFADLVLSWAGDSLRFILW